MNPVLTGARAREAIRLALVFAAIKFVVHFGANLWESHIGWGYFRDELYYIACGRRLAWGYFDHGPLVAVQARASELLFGHSLAGLRLISTLGGASRVFLTGILAYLLGGRRPAQGPSMIAILFAPAYLGTDSVLSMGSLESTFWMVCLASLLLLQHQLGLMPYKEVATPIPSSVPPSLGSSKRGGPTLAPSLLFGIVAGLGFLNKPTMGFFLLALVLALAGSRSGRSMLLRRESAASLLLTVAIAAPYFLWQWHHQWPLLDFLHAQRLARKAITLGPLDFFVEQIIALSPPTGLVWLPGLVYLLRRGRTAYLGVTYLFSLAFMIALGAKGYYLQPIYPVLFAAGGIVWERLLSRRRRVVRNCAIAFPAASAVLVFSALAVLPMSLPVLTPKQWIRYATSTGLYLPAEEGPDSGPLQGFYADRFGWQEETDNVTRIVAALPESDRAQLTILCDDYGEASALQFLNPSLTNVISAQNTYWIWGPGTHTGKVVLLITGRPLSALRREYRQVDQVGTMHTTRFERPSVQQHLIFLARDRRTTLQADWASLR